MVAFVMMSKQELCYTVDVFILWERNVILQKTRRVLGRALLKAASQKVENLIRKDRDKGRLSSHKLSKGFILYIPVY